MGEKSVKLQVETIGCNGPVATLASETEAEPRIKGAYRGYTNFRVGRTGISGPDRRVLTKCVCKNGKQPFIDTNVCVSTYTYIYTHTVYMAQRLVVPSPWDV